MDEEAIGRRIREARVSAGLSQSELGKAAGVSPSYVSLMEAGRRAPSTDVFARIARVLEVPVGLLRYGPQGSSEQQALLTLDHARLSLAQGDAATAVERLSAVDLAGVGPQARGSILLTLARAHELAGDIEAAVRILEPLLTQMQDRSRHIEAAEVAVALCACCIAAGDLTRAVEIAESELRTVEAADLTGTDQHMMLGSCLVWAFMERGDLLTAQLRAETLIAQGEAVGGPRGRGAIYWNAAIVAEQRGQIDLAHRYASRATTLLGGHGDDRDVARLRLAVAHLHLAGPDPDPYRALRELDQADPSLRVCGSEIDQATADVERSRALLFLGDVGAAEEHARAALARLGDQPRLETCDAWIALGDALHHGGQGEPAFEAYAWVAGRLGMMQASRRAAQVWAQLAARFAERGDRDREREAYGRALAELGMVQTPIPRPRLGPAAQAGR